jgi:hypothetical protein
MKLVRLLTIAGSLAAGLTLAVHANAQGPMYDKVIVDLPYAVTVNNTTLQPGHYVIRQFNSSTGDSRILQIFTNGGMKLETTALTIPTLDPNTPEKTRVILHHYGNDYYFDKVWVQGKNYGYEFPLPAAVKARQNERMEPYTVAAQYEAQPAPTQVAEVAATPAPEPAPAPAPQAEAPMPTPAPEPTVASAPAPETNRMPATADGWGLEVAAGLLLIGATGFLLRRRTA